MTPDQTRDSFKLRLKTNILYQIVRLMYFHNITVEEVAVALSENKILELQQSRRSKDLYLKQKEVIKENGRTSKGGKSSRQKAKPDREAEITTPTAG